MTFSRISADLEFNSKGVLYALDCWDGFFPAERSIMLEYVPDDIFNDAVDLELSGDRFIYARREMEISIPLKYLHLLHKISPSP